MALQREVFNSEAAFSHRYYGQTSPTILIYIGGLDGVTSQDIAFALTRERAQRAEDRVSQLQLELEALSREMRHDQLTGVLNRRGLEEMFRKECANAERHDRGLCVALLDIDNFKKINDTYGHQAGDDALVHLATVIRHNLRPNDTVARLGGEEFVILYPESTLQEATAALTRLQRQLDRSFVPADGAKLRITFSAGVSPWQAGEPLEIVLKRADAAMYEAKHNGKNRVIAHPIHESSPAKSLRNLSRASGRTDLKGRLNNTHRQTSKVIPISA